jgi:hypothetical protein
MEKMLNTQILEAIESGDLDAFSRLVGQDDALRNSPNTFGSWLHCACAEGQLPIVIYLVENGADLDLRGDIAGVMGDAGPIDDAAGAGHLEVVQYLLSRGARLDVGAPTRNPLFSAIHNGHRDVVRSLLNAGIDRDVTYRTDAGKLRNALSFAVEQDQLEIADMLVKAGCRLPIEGVDKPVWEPEEVHQETAEDEAHKQIIAHMAATFGPVDLLAMQEIFPIHDEVHIAINVIPPNDGHPYLTLFTTGMSDVAMQAPTGQEAYQYAELVMHLPADWPHPRGKAAGEDVLWPCTWLRQAAYYPHLNHTWLGGPMVIISSDDPPVPLGPNTKQTCLLLLADFGEWSPSAIENKEVHFYTVIPIYTEERDFEKKHGVVPLVQRLQEHGYTVMVDVNRGNVGIERRLTP